MSTDPTTWPDLAVALYDRLTGQRAEITYEFEQFAVQVPASAAPDAPSAHWKLDGKIRIHTAEHAA